MFVRILLSPVITQTPSFTFSPVINNTRWSAPSSINRNNRNNLSCTYCSADRFNQNKSSVKKIRIIFWDFRTHQTLIWLEVSVTEHSMCCLFIGRWRSFRLLLTIIWMCETESDKCRFLLRVNMLHKKDELVLTGTATSLWVHQVCSKRPKVAERSWQDWREILRTERENGARFRRDRCGRTHEWEHLLVNKKNQCLKRNVSCTIGEEGLIWRHNQAAIKPVKKNMHMWGLTEMLAWLKTAVCHGNKGIHTVASLNMVETSALTRCHQHDYCAIS